MSTRDQRFVLALPTPAATRRPNRRVRPNRLSRSRKASNDRTVACQTRCEALIPVLQRPTQQNRFKPAGIDVKIGLEDPTILDAHTGDAHLAAQNLCNLPVDKLDSPPPPGLFQKVFQARKLQVIPI